MKEIKIEISIHASIDKTCGALVNFNAHSTWSHFVQLSRENLGLLTAR